MLAAAAAVSLLLQTLSHAVSAQEAPSAITTTGNSYFELYSYKHE